MNVPFWIGYVAMAVAVGLIIASNEVSSIGTMHRLRRWAIVPIGIMLLSWALVVGIRISS